MKKVRNKANAINTWLGGVCCVPKACLKIDITITILVNEVIPSTKEGKTVKNDINNNICNDNEYVVPPSGLFSTFTAGKPPKVSKLNNSLWKKRKDIIIEKSFKYFLILIILFTTR